MSESMNSVLSYLEQHAGEQLEDLKSLLRIPSISADPAYQQDVRKAAEFIKQQLESAGCSAEIVETAGHPIVYGEWIGDPNQPTALIYGHYDVQPADPLEEWVSPPFEPTVRDGKIWARGATDDKGQMLTHVKSVQAWLKSVGKLPVNVKFLIEGEEEVGSRNLDDFLEANKDRCRCDVAVISDSSQYAPGIPAITYSLRGLLACEVTLKGPKQDLHSGMFGGSVANPVNALAKLIGKLHDDEGRVQIPGFYDDVLPLTNEEREAFAALPFDDQADLEHLGVQQAFGEVGFSTLERRWARPTCDVNGFVGGYTGEGPKTIVPSQARAKITCRLVPNQQADPLVHSLEQFLREHCPPGLKLDFKTWHGCPAFLCDVQSPSMHAALAAVEKGFGTPPVMIRGGGSIPVVATFKEILGVDTLLLGWGQETDNLHSPNEHFDLKAFQQGTIASAWLWELLGERS